MNFEDEKYPLMSGTLVGSNSWVPPPPPEDLGILKTLTLYKNQKMKKLLWFKI